MGAVQCLSNVIQGPDQGPEQNRRNWFDGLLQVSLKQSKVVHNKPVALGCRTLCRFADQSPKYSPSACSAASKGLFQSGFMVSTAPRPITQHGGQQQATDTGSAQQQQQQQQQVTVTGQITYRRRLSAKLVNNG
jgi:hypothetical protein